MTDTAPAEPAPGGMIPFDISKARRGAKVVTRNKMAARIVCDDMRFWDGQPRILALANFATLGVALCEVPIVADMDGRAGPDGQRSDFDLFLQRPDDGERLETNAAQADKSAMAIKIIAAGTLVVCLILILGVVFVASN